MHSHSSQNIKINNNIKSDILFFFLPRQFPLAHRSFITPLIKSQILALHDSYDTRLRYRIKKNFFTIFFLHPLLQLLKQKIEMKKVDHLIDQVKKNPF